MSQSSHREPRPLRREPLLPFPISRWKIGLGIALMVLAVIEIQFAEQSFDFFYTNLRAHFAFLDDYFATTKQTGSTFAIALTIIVWRFLPRARHTLVPFFIAVLISSTIVSVTKEAAGRSRPPFGVRLKTDENSAELEWLHNWIRDNPFTTLEPRRADYWLWFSPDRPHLSGHFASFPSGHATGAMVIAVYLSTVAPRGRILWYVLAVGCAVARVRYLRHHPGDILFGAGLGFITAYAVFASYWPVRLGHWANTKLEGILRTDIPTLPPVEYDKLYGDEESGKPHEEAAAKSTQEGDATAPDQPGRES